MTCVLNEKGPVYTQSHITRTYIGTLFWKRVAEMLVATSGGHGIYKIIAIFLRIFGKLNVLQP